MFKWLKLGTGGSQKSLSWAQAGLDSLGAVELRNAIAAKFGVALPATVAFDFPTASALAGYVRGALTPADPVQSPQVCIFLAPHYESWEFSGMWRRRCGLG